MSTALQVGEDACWLQRFCVRCATLSRGERLTSWSPPPFLEEIPTSKTQSQGGFAGALARGACAASLLRPPAPGWSPAETRGRVSVPSCLGPAGVCPEHCLSLLPFLVILKFCVTCTSVLLAWGLPSWPWEVTVSASSVVVSRRCVQWRGLTCSCWC